MRISPRRTGVLLALVAVVCISCVGCLGADVEIVVHPDGTGTFGLAFGMDGTLRAMMTADAGEDPLSSWADDMEFPENASIHQWTEDGIDWAKISAPFSSLHEVNAVMQEVDVFAQSFQITKHYGLVKDYFEVEAQLSPLTSYLDLDSTDAWASSMIDVSLSVSLPGEIVRCNGSRTGIWEGSPIRWTLAPDRPTQVYALSERVNGSRLAVVIVSLVLLFVGSGLALSGLVTLLRRHRDV
jgi:hypothetical protein